ncbi:MAG: hypothetical protein AUG49_01300 [Catenulispora sp. 13_1_20CM_3_70_7]|nr:MAG: hypothetical protein AUG49_01300 [Catenulispora sp. 13_1_20CM_3_70_7]
MNNLKQDHEDAALAALVDELTGRGKSVRITDHPDRSPGNTLTVDALIDIDGTIWAVDHCLVSRPPQLPPAVANAEKLLEPALEALAVKEQCRIVASFAPISGKTGKAQDATFYQDMIAKVTVGIATRKTVYEPNRFHIEFTEDDPEVVLMPWAVDGAAGLSSADQVDEGLRDAVTKKLNGQLSRAKQVGYPTMLLLDQIPRPGTMCSTVWNAGPTAVAGAIQRIIDDHRHNNPPVLDQVWLRPIGVGSPMSVPGVHFLLDAR